MLSISVIIYPHEVHIETRSSDSSWSYRQAKQTATTTTTTKKKIIPSDRTYYTDWLAGFTATTEMAVLCTVLLPELISYCYKSIESWTVRFDGLIVRRIKFWLLEFNSVCVSLSFSAHLLFHRFVRSFVWWVMNRRRMLDFSPWNDWYTHSFTSRFFFHYQNRSVRLPLDSYKRPYTIWSKNLIDQVTKVL